MLSSREDRRPTKFEAVAKRVYHQEAAEAPTYNGDISGGVNATYESGGNLFSDSHNRSTFERVISAGNDVHMPTVHVHFNTPPVAASTGITEERTSFIQQILRPVMAFFRSPEIRQALVHPMPEETATVTQETAAVPDAESTAIHGSTDTHESTGCEGIQDEIGTDDEIETRRSFEIQCKSDWKMSSMSDLDLQLVQSQATTHAVIYTSRMLSSCPDGLPCWRPAPFPPTDQQGVVPGDVGTFNLVRGFKKIFNLWEDGCAGSSQLPQETIVVDDHFPKGHIIPNGISSKTLRSKNGKSILELNFTCNAEQGALLACTRSADLEQLSSTVALEKFLIENAGVVYRHASNIQPIGKEESLYIITGCIKSDGWSLAAFCGAKSDELLKLSKRHAEDDSTDAGKIYDWIDLGPAEARLWPSTAKQAGIHKKNQSLFLQGFKLAFSAQFRARMDGLHLTVPEQDPSTVIEEATDSRTPEMGHRGTGDGMLGSASSAGNSSTTNVGLQLNSFPDNTIFHPCDTINRLLLEMTGADCAVSHDNDWRHGPKVQWWKDKNVHSLDIISRNTVSVSRGVAHLLPRLEDSTTDAAMDRTTNGGNISAIPAVQQVPSLPQGYPIMVLNTPGSHRLPESCGRFNNAVQRLFRKDVAPTIFTFERNDPIDCWGAEARLVRRDDGTLMRLFQSSAPTRKLAKEIAADAAYQWLCAQYPHVDLSNVYESRYR
ncbi:hypothetical protein EST38_g11504 [Candolleomyces aberdarensis]|uniref:DRBM domain-containing protein n=1 Tax=Candolleomyces aberdarensis TaxID=2316362 RepID=A0A4Q2D703_9AGAR|nr:hypothetical protein EST38_g11504 [Candolleomyces aberdarensis]